MKSTWIFWAAWLVSGAAWAAPDTGIDTAEPAQMTHREIQDLKSKVVLVMNQDTGEVLYGKGTTLKKPIASITKVMTAMVTLDANLPLDEMITVNREDIDHLRKTGSRLRLGATLSRQDMLLLALMASENRAASALARTYPGGLDAFINAMNRKARQLGMRDSRFVDGTGLSGMNVSTAADLARMVNAAHDYPLIRQLSTMKSHHVSLDRGGLEYRNTNALVRDGEWNIGLSKTGFINEAGRCLVMQARLSGQPVIIVLLDSWGKYSRIGDAIRLKKWLGANAGGNRRTG